MNAVEKSFLLTFYNNDNLSEKKAVLTFILFKEMGIGLFRATEESRMNSRFNHKNVFKYLKRMFA